MQLLAHKENLRVHTLGWWRDQGRTLLAQGHFWPLSTIYTHQGTLSRCPYPGWEEGFGVEVGSSPIQGSRIKFLCTVIEDVQKRFNESEWGGGVAESWVEASSCSCERVFSYVTATDFGHSTERMCETLWVRCNGEAPEDWGPFEVFDELHTSSTKAEGKVCR